MTKGRTLRQLLTDRLAKHGFYDTPAYWNMKAQAYQGLARSNWPSNTYNEELHARQMQVIDQLLGDATGLRVADVGCGTGRVSMHLAKRGARVLGFDFSEKALMIARQDAEREDLSATFQLADVLGRPSEELQAQFDVVLSLGCLTLACRDREAFDRAVANLVSLLRPGGRLLFVEPIHASRLLGRILRMNVEEWITRCENSGLELLSRGGLLFVPARYLLAFRDLPRGVVAPVFDAGERLLRSYPLLEPLSDYKWLLFRAPPERPPPSPAG